MFPNLFTRCYEVSFRKFIEGIPFTKIPIAKVQSLYIFGQLQKSYIAMLLFSFQEGSLNNIKILATFYENFSFVHLEN